MSHYVTKEFCDERERRIFETLERIEQKIDKAEANRKNDIVNHKTQAATNTLEKRRSYEALRTFGYAAAGGAIVAIFNYVLRII